MQNFTGIVCKLDSNSAIGYGNNLIYRLKGDLKRFKAITTESEEGEKNVVVIGYKTFLSMSCVPLPGRITIVLSRICFSSMFKRFRDNKNVHILSDLAYLPKCLSKIPHTNVFIIGGSQIFKQCFEKNYFSRLLVTDVLVDQEEDFRIHYNAFFPTEMMETTMEMTEESEVVEENDVELIPIKKKISTVRYIYRTFERRVGNAEETNYLNLLKECAFAPIRMTRNGKTRAIFGKTLLFDVGTNGPVCLTTKKMAKLTCVRELLWFISGSSNSKVLEEKKCLIWKQNTSKAFLKANEKEHLKEGSTGPLYGHNLRHFGASWKGCDHDYEKQGRDQLLETIESIKTNGTSRRHMFTSYDPANVELAVLYPCHGIITQFFVRNETILDVCTYQRSADVFLGLPFNLLSYSLLLIMVAAQTGLNPGRLTYHIGDLHLYEDHEKVAKKQIQRMPFPFPGLDLADRDCITKYTEEDITFVNYRHHQTLKAKMVA